MSRNAIMTSRTLRRKNIFKVTRTVLELALVVAAVVWVVLKLLAGDPDQYRVIADPAYITAYEGAGLSQSEAAGADWLTDGDERFVCISYNGISTSMELGSKLVSQKEFNAQMAALKASGYVTITQQDVLDAYRNHTPLPEKAMLLLFEDGIYSSAALAQPAMEEYNYIGTMCSYAQNLVDSDGRYITADNIKQLLSNSYWELGSNGYRLSYINVFDRHENYFGSLNLDEFLAVDEYLKRDYNHYLMDFIRDEDRLRLESVEEMEKRIAYDYDQMHDIYNSQLGFVPSLYVLMHSNTDMFGNDPLVSNKNGEMISKVFGMNFNRQGSCLNTTASSVYDLTRLQSRHYFATNHLMMRVWDDTGDNVAFLVGDVAEAKNWLVDKGVAEYADGEKIILTSLPHGVGRMTLSGDPIENPDMTVTLQGNIVGRQSIFLRSDRDAETGIEVALEDNVLLVRTPGGEDAIFSMDLYEHDTPVNISEEQKELEGLQALQDAIITFDKDPVRISEAQLEKQNLASRTAPSIEEGGTPYEPVLDISMRDERQLRIRLLGSRLSLWLDDVLVADNLTVDAGETGYVVLEAGVSDNNDRFSQANLADDVYDAVFIDPVIRDAKDDTTVYHAYTWKDLSLHKSVFTRIWEQIETFFVKYF